MLRKVLIVEDIEMEARGLESLLLSVDEELEVFITGYCSEALDICKKGKISLFLLDVQLNDYSGLKLAQDIRELDQYKLTPIVFITGVLGKELMAFKNYHCYDYILKPFKKNEVVKVLTTLLFGKGSLDEVIKIKQRDFTYIIRLDELIYAEMLNRKLYIYLKEEELEVSNMIFRDFISQLPENFIQIHRSYIVNKKKVLSISMSLKKVFLINGKSVPIGEKFLFSVMEKLQ